LGMPPRTRWHETQRIQFSGRHEAVAIQVYLRDR
jgi:hypothetical protein